MHLSLLSAGLLALPFASALPTVLAPRGANCTDGATNSTSTTRLVPANQLGAGADPSTAGRNRTIGHFPRPADFTETPTYATFSGLDYASIYLGVHQEYIEQISFSDGLAKFSEQQLADAKLDAELTSLITFMAKQEVGHALVLSNMLGESAPKPCTYKFDFQSVREYINFNVDITRFGEDGVLGFLPSLDNRAVAQILLQSITTESRQQLQFRQLLGLPSMVESFETGIPQTWAWTLLSQYIESCPSSNAPVQWDIYPQLRIGNDPNQTALTNGPAIYTNVTALSAPGDRIELSWDDAGKTSGPYNQTTYKPANGTAMYAAFVSQYNVTYMPLQEYTQGNNSAVVTQPGGVVLPQLTTTEIFNNTIYVAITDANPFLTPLNLTLINTHIVAGPALYHSG